MDRQADGRLNGQRDGIGLAKGGTMHCIGRQNESTPTRSRLVASGDMANAAVIIQQSRNSWSRFTCNGRYRSRTDRHAHGL